MVTEESDERVRLFLDEVCFQSVGESLVCVLIFVDENNREANGQQLPKLSDLHQLDCEGQYIIVKEGDVGFCDSPMSEFIISDPSRANAARFFEFFSPGTYAREFSTKIRLEILDK